MIKGTHTDMKARMGALKQSKSVYKGCCWTVR